jgi:hypothetical protein
MVLLIYHGTFSIVLKVLDWNRCNISMLEFEAVLQSCIPYVQIGLITTLYKSNFLSIDSVDCLPSSQHIFLNLRLSCFLFILICFAQVSLRSRCISRYFTSFSCGRATLFIWAVGQVKFLVVNVICADFVWLTFIFHFFVHCSRLLISFWSLAVAVSGWSSGASIAVSSAKVAVFVSSLVGKSAV